MGKPKIVKNGLFRSNTFCVALRLSPLGWKTTRTFDDFRWLHAALKSRFPAHFVAELPEIGGTEETKDADLYLLAAYLNHAANSTDLRYSPELVDFLRLSETDLAQTKKVRASHQKPVQSYFRKPRDILDFNQHRPIDKMQAPRGVVEMDMNPGVKKVSRDIGRLVASCHDNTRAAESLCADIGFHLDKAGDLAQKLARYVHKINQDYADYFEHNKVSPVVEIGAIYDAATDLLAEVGSQLRRSSAVFQKDMQQMFRFSNFENEGFQRLIELRNSFAESYEEAKIGLERKKVVLLESKDVRRWGVDPTRLGFRPEELLGNTVLAKKYMLPQVGHPYVGIHARARPARLRGVSQQAGAGGAGHVHGADAGARHSVFREVRGCCGRAAGGPATGAGGAARGSARGADGGERDRGLRV